MLGYYYVHRSPKGLGQENPTEDGSTYLPCLWFVAAEDLIGSQQIQLAMALLKHVDTGKPPG